MSTINDKFYREIRCDHCRKLLGYEYIFAGRLAFFCSRCGELIQLNFKHMQSKENADTINSEFSITNPIHIHDAKSQEKGGE